MGSKCLLVIFVFVLFCGAANAQTFDSEKDIRKPAKIPAGILKLLKQTDQVDLCLIPPAFGDDGFSASWFQGARVNLNGDRFSDYLIKSNDSCLNGPRAATWWIFRGSANGFVKVFEDSVLLLKIKRTKTRNFYDLETETTMMNIIRNTWKFDGRKYKLKSTKIVKVG